MELLPPRWFSVFDIKAKILSFDLERQIISKPGSGGVESLAVTCPATQVISPSQDTRRDNEELMLVFLDRGRKPGPEPGPGANPRQNLPAVTRRGRPVRWLHARKLSLHLCNSTGCPPAA